jgi:hypothetical protein
MLGPEPELFTGARAMKMTSASCIMHARKPITMDLIELGG